MIQKLIQEVVLPTLVTSLDSLKTEVSDVLTPRASGSIVEASEESVHSAFSQVEDTLNFISMLVSIVHSAMMCELNDLYCALIFCIFRVRRQHAKGAPSLKQGIRLLYS